MEDTVIRPGSTNYKDQTHMTSDLQGEMITALENFRDAVENGTLNPEIVRSLVEAVNAARRP